MFFLNRWLQIYVSFSVDLFTEFRSNFSQKPNISKYESESWIEYTLLQFFLLFTEDVQAAVS